MRKANQTQIDSNTKNPIRLTEATRAASTSVPVTPNRFTKGLTSHTAAMEATPGDSGIRPDHRAGKAALFEDNAQQRKAQSNGDADG